MKYNFNGRNITISDEELKRNMRVLDLTKEEAIQMYLEDRDLIPVGADLVPTDTASTYSKDATAPKKKKRKENKNKIEIINFLFNFLNTKYENVKIENPQKIITLSYGGEEYKLDLIRRTKKTLDRAG